MNAHALSLAHVTVDVQRRDVTGRRTGLLRVLDGCSLDIDAGEAMVLVGPSRCGKSTLLDLFAGYAQPAAGTVRVGRGEVTGPALGNGFVPPTYAQFPWRSARDNVAFALAGGVPERTARADEALDLVGLAEAAERAAVELTPAHRVRLALARALVHRPGALLVDNPFAELDDVDRRLLQDDLIRIQRDAGVTLVFATASLDEAVRIGDRVAVLTARPGRIETVVTVDPERPLAAAHALWAALNPVAEVRQAA